MRERIGTSGVFALRIKVTEQTVRVKTLEEDMRVAELTKLKAARKKVQDLADVVRSAAFDDWVRRFVEVADRPDEWTQARPLYESYLRQAKNYGWNRPDRAVVREELATETAWGKMMGSLFTKKRRPNGQHYPVRLKQGA